MVQNKDFFLMIFHLLLLLMNKIILYLLGELFHLESFYIL